MNIKDFVLGYLIGKGDGGGGASVEPLTVTENGEYSEEGVAYSPVTVNVAGGGGLEYETGTWTPSADIAQQQIAFNNAHSNPPFAFAIVDITGTNQSVTSSNVFVLFCDFAQLGNPINISDGSLEYGRMLAGRKNTSTNIATTIKQLTSKSTSGTSSDRSNVRYWATETYIYATDGDNSDYWRAGRTYKWIAVWAPTA